MTTEKVAVSIPSEILARARRSAKREHASSLSAYLSAALEEKSTTDDLSHLLNELLASSGGPLTAKERKEADRALVRRPSRKKRS